MLAGMVEPPDPVAHRIQHDQLFFDSSIVSHGFAPFLRDYDVTIDVPSTTSDRSGSYIAGRYRYRFTHCTEAIARTTVTPDAWQKSWDDLYIDRRAWEQAESPGGYLWAVAWADAYPGMTYVANSDRAKLWSDLVSHKMHEVLIESNAFRLALVFHDLRIAQLGVGGPDAGTLDLLD
jgi:hypothetical protein